MQQTKINKIAVIALLFSLLSLAGSGIINNYYSCGNCTNGTNGSNGSNGMNANETEIKFYDVADSYTSCCAFQNSNYGTSTNLFIGSKHTFIKFETINLTGNQIENITLQLNFLGGNDIEPVKINSVNNDWNESNITRNNEPTTNYLFSFFPVTGLNNITVPISAYGYMLNTDDPEQGAVLLSRETTSDNYIKIILDFNNFIDYNLSNYTNNPGFVTNATMTSDITKVNKSGNERITGNVTISNDSIFQKIYIGDGAITTESNSNGFTIYVTYDENKYGSSAARIVIDDIDTANATSGKGNQKPNAGFQLRENGINTWSVASYQSAGNATVNATRGTMTFYNAILNKEGWGMSGLTNNFTHNGNVSINSPYEYKIASLAGVGNRPLCADPIGNIVLC